MPNNTGGVTPEPPSLEKRLPLALALMMLVLVVSQYIFKPAPGPKPVTPVNNKAAAKLTEKPAVSTAAATAVPVAPNATPAAGAIQAAAETESQIDTALYHIVFTNRGAAIKSWVLKKYKDKLGKPLELINSAANSLPLPFTIEVTGGQKLTVDPNTALYQVTASPDGMRLTYEFSDGHTTIHKSFQFARDSYLTDVKSEVLENNTPVAHLLVWRGGFGDQKVFNAAGTEHSVRYDASASKLVTKTAKDAKNGPITDSGNYTFGGLEDNFFAAVALPSEGSTLEIRTFSDELKPAGQEKNVAYVGAGISTGAQNDISLFVGPKDIDILKSVNPKLSQIVNWGFFGVLAKPLFLWLNWTNDHWTNNYGWAIILVTVIINLGLFPLRISSLKSARKMQKLQPQIQAINAKYKNVS